MLSQIKKKISSSKLNTQPFPYIFIKDLFDENYVKKLNKLLPSYQNLKGDDIMFQSKSGSKKTLLPSSPKYKALKKKHEFNYMNSVFKQLKPHIIKKFKNYIVKYVKKKINTKKLKYHSSYSVMTKGYKKSPHIDRRDHLIHMIFYSESDASKGGEIIINKVKKKKNVFDVFPSKSLSKVHKKYKVYKNSLLIILNVPWAYHSVNYYRSTKDRKYLYMVYDFPIKNSGSMIKNRKKGFNANNYWMNDVAIMSSKRRNTFLTE